ncbi:helix-loop-helix protein delilah-like [Penaeus japonicus]|uniref:helix-loop-helix protein delilah-like n=1 Tax=Penaeus japonicus TaxID=27405 RepID=UPI001C717066|nr:helix-loop-helix protein delilah-like [Penaeus japonicus]
MARLDDQETMKNSEMGIVDDNNNSDSNSSSPEGSPDAAKSPGASNGKYQLRPRSVHARRLCDSDWNFGESLRHKPRAAPLSRYRRKTANARERYRMRQINTAFESLRGVLPSWVCSRRAASDMTKIATLRLASAYIRSLQDILDGSAPQDTCSWVLSAILDNTPSSPQKPASPIHHQASNGQFLEHHAGQGTDLVSILAGASSHQVFQDNLESFCYMSPVSHNDDFMLGCEPPRVWSEA